MNRNKVTEKIFELQRREMERKSDQRPVEFSEEVTVLDAEPVPGDIISFLTFTDSSKTARQIRTLESPYFWHPYAKERIRLSGLVFPEPDPDVKTLIVREIERCEKKKQTATAASPDEDAAQEEREQKKIRSGIVEKAHLLPERCRGTILDGLQKAIDDGKRLPEAVTPMKRAVASELDELRLLYQVNEPYMGETSAEIIKRYLESTESIRSDSIKKNILRALRDLLSFPWSYRRGNFEISEIAKNVEALYPKKGVSEELCQIFREFNLENPATREVPCILLIGRNADYLADRLFSDVLQISYGQVDLSGKEDPDLFLNGSNQGYENGMPGILSRQILCNEGKKKEGLLIRRLDQGSSKCESALIPIFAEHTLKDDFYDCPVPLGQVPVVATCYDELKISQAILSNVKKIYINDLTEGEAIRVINDSMVPRIAARYGICPEPLSDDVCRLILSCFGGVLAQMEEGIRKLLSNAVENRMPLSEMTVKEAAQALTYPDATEAKDSYVTTYSEIAWKVSRCGESYAPSIRKAIDRELDEARTVNVNDGHNQSMEKLRILANLQAPKKDWPDIRRVRQTMDQLVYGHEREKRSVLRMIAGSRRTGRTGKALLLVGPPGTGKSWMGEVIARSLQSSFAVIQASALTQSSELRGSQTEPGIIVRKQSERGVQSMGGVLLVDEFEKIVDQNPGLFGSFYDLLNPNSTLMYERFLDAEIPTDQLVIVLTCNSLKGIPDPLLNRVEIVELEGYSSEEKRKILHEYLLPRYRDCYGFRKLEMSEKASRRLISADQEAGIRTIEKRLVNMIDDTLLKDPKARDLMIDEELVALVLSEESVKDTKIGFTDR